MTQANLDDLRGRVLATLDAFVAAHPDSDLVWVAVPVLWAKAMVSHDLPVPAPAALREAAAAARRERTRIVLRPRRRPMYIDLAGDALFAATTENHRRVIRPVAERLSGRRPAPRLRALDGLGMRPDLAAASHLAGELLDRVAADRVPFIDPLLTWRAFLGGARALAHARGALGSSRPAVVIAATNHGQETRALALEARRAGVASVYIPHAPLLREDRLRDLPFDYAALRGAREVQVYEQLGAAPEQLLAAGNPALAPRAEPVAIAKDAPVVLALSPHAPEVLRPIVEATRAAAGENVVVAPHPRQDLDALEAIRPAAWTVWDGRTYDLLREGPSAVVQYSSGVALEAMLLGVPVVEVNFVADAVNYPFLRTPLVESADAPEQLPAALRNAIAHAGDDAFRARLVEWGRSWCADSDGPAADAIAGLIARAADRGPAAEPVWDAWRAPSPVSTR